MQEVTRRKILKRVGATSAATGVASVAGCTGNSDDGEVTFTMAGGQNPDLMCWKGDCELPWSPYWEFIDRIEERTGGEISNSEFITGGEMCLSCLDQVENNVIDFGFSSFSFLAERYPEAEWHQIPYLFPSPHAWTYAVLGSSYAWEEFWVPFAQKYGIIPILIEGPYPEQYWVGDDFASEIDGMVTSPEDLAGSTIRTVGSEAYGTAYELFDASIVSTATGEFVQGLDSGVMDLGIFAEGHGPVFGFGDVSDHVVGFPNGINLGDGSIFVRVDWLRDLTDDQIEALSEVTRELSEEFQPLYDEWRQERLGITESPPPEGSILAEIDVDVSVISEEENEAFKERISYQDNPDTFTGVIEPALEMAGDDFVENIIDIGENETPSVDDFQVEAWWGDYISEM